MGKEESIVQKPRTLLSEAVLPQSADDLAKFMDQPLTAIAEAITGMLAAGPTSWTVMAGHIVQAILKGKLYEQVSQEIKQLREKGKIPDDFADEKKHKYGFKSWVELLTIIDEETPDSDRLEALKAMFYGINKVNATDGERIAGYQLFQIAKKLTSGQVLYLRACYKLYTEGSLQAQNMDVVQWLGRVGQVLGHNVIGLLEQDDNAVRDYGLVTDRLTMDRNKISTRDAHLSPLGLIFCKNIETYHQEVFSECGAG